MLCIDAQASGNVSTLINGISASTHTESPRVRLRLKLGGCDDDVAEEGDDEYVVEEGDEEYDGGDEDEDEL